MARPLGLRTEDLCAVTLFALLRFTSEAAEADRDERSNSMVFGGHERLLLLKYLEHNPLPDSFPCCYNNYTSTVYLYYKIKYLEVTEKWLSLPFWSGCFAFKLHT